MLRCEYCKAEVVQMADLDYCPDCEIIVEGHVVDEVQKTHFADDETLKRLERYREGLERIIKSAPANGEDVSYLIAKEALRDG